jgi:hypothetical protein
LAAGANRGRCGSWASAGRAMSEETRGHEDYEGTGDRNECMSSTSWSPSLVDGEGSLSPTDSHLSVDTGIATWVAMQSGGCTPASNSRSPFANSDSHCSKKPCTSTALQEGPVVTSSRTEYPSKSPTSEQTFKKSLAPSMLPSSAQTSKEDEIATKLVDHLSPPSGGVSEAKFLPPSGGVATAPHSEPPGRKEVRSQGRMPGKFYY